MLISGDIIPKNNFATQQQRHQPKEVPKKHVRSQMFLPRIKSLVEHNLSKMVKDFSLGGEKNSVKLNIYPVLSPPGTYYIEARFVMNARSSVVAFGGLYSNKIQGIDSVCEQMLHWLCVTPPYSSFFSEYSTYPHKTKSQNLRNEAKNSLPRAPEPH